MFRLSVQIFFVFCLTLLYCRAELASSKNNIVNAKVYNAQSSSLVGAVDLVYCFFDTSSSKLKIA